MISECQYLLKEVLTLRDHIGLSVITHVRWQGQKVIWAPIELT